MWYKWNLLQTLCKRENQTKAKCLKGWVVWQRALGCRYELCTLAAALCTALPSPSGFSPTTVQSNYFSWESPLMLAAAAFHTKCAVCFVICECVCVCANSFLYIYRWKNVFASQLGSMCVCVCSIVDFSLPWLNWAIQLFGLLCSTSSQFIVAIRMFLFLLFYVTTAV